MAVANSNVAVIKKFGIQSDTDRTIFATWTWSKSNTDKYQAKWWYDTGNGVWFVGSDSETKEKQSLYTAPQNAKRVKFQVKPISKTYNQKSGNSTKKSKPNIKNSPEPCLKPQSKGGKMVVWKRNSLTALQRR